MFVENVPSRSFIVAEVVIENVAECGAGCVTCGTRNMTLDILRESYGRQGIPRTCRVHRRFERLNALVLSAGAGSPSVAQAIRKRDEGKHFNFMN